MERANHASETGTTRASLVMGGVMDSNTTMVALIVAAVIIVALVAWIIWQRQRSDRLRRRFGREYEHEVHRAGSVSRAEAALENRQRRVEKLHIRPLTEAQAAEFGKSWRAIQARFVDDPTGAVTEADRVVGEVMHARGYPVGEFEQRVADIS